jgi:hypothetical protein
MGFPVGIPGAMQKMVSTSRGERSGGHFALGHIQEFAVHGWDLAIATGQDPTLDRELAEAGYAHMAANGERMPAPGNFGLGDLAIPDDQDLQSTYLAMCGCTAPSDRIAPMRPAS